MPPSHDDIKKLSKYTDLTVSTRSESDWYCLTRKCQGSFVNVLESGYFLGTNNPPEITLFIEYYYVLDFDKMCFDICGKEYSLDNLPNY